MGLVAAGVPVWGHVRGGFDLWPVLYVVVSLAIVLGVAGRPLTVPKALVAILAGTLWTWVTDAFGVIPAGAWMVLVTAVCGGAYRRARVRRAES
jgi:hypothetical protein